MTDDSISRQAAIDAINSYFGFSIEEEYGSAVQEVINGLPSAEPNRIARETAGKSPDEIYDILYWLMSDYGKQFTDSRAAVIEWLKEERRENG